MPIIDLLSELGIMPLRAIAFQSLLLLVAIVLEAIVLRQKLKLGYQTSMQYAATINLLATSLGWIGFLSLEALLPAPVRRQVISYVLFNRLYPNAWVQTLPVLAVGLAIGAFFITYWIKLGGLLGLMRLLERDVPVTEAVPMPTTRMARYEMARSRQSLPQRSDSSLALAVLQANALSFTAILLLLLLHNGVRAA